MKILIIAALLAGGLFSQTYTSKTTWTNSVSAGVSGYKVYRKIGPCDPTNTNPFVLRSLTLVTVQPFTDSVTVGSWCAVVTAVRETLQPDGSKFVQESAYSIEAVLVIDPPPTAPIGVKTSVVAQ